jgi:hypothetical protein
LLVGAGFVAYVASMTTVALLQGDGVFPTGLVLICLGGGQMLGVCLFADWQ